MYLPSVHHVTHLNPGPTGLARDYVTLKLPAYGGDGTALVTTTTLDGVADPGGCMVHLPSASFAGGYGDMRIIG